MIDVVFSTFFFMSIIEWEHQATQGAWLDRDALGFFQSRGFMPGGGV